jgi:hypothetical protein
MVTNVSTQRDPKFRQGGLVADEYRCEVSGFDVCLGSVSVALGAAHIRGHQAGDPYAPADHVIVVGSIFWVGFLPGVLRSRPLLTCRPPVPS